jgi:hypothetical protein
MIDITATRVMASRNHPPLIAYCLLAGLRWSARCSSATALPSMSDRNWLHNLVFYGHPRADDLRHRRSRVSRFGLIRIDTATRLSTSWRDSLR